MCFNCYRGRDVYWDSSDSASASEEDESQDMRDPNWPFYSIGSPDDVLVPQGAVCQEMSKLLGQLNHKEEKLAIGGEANELPAYPGLTVRGFGGIALPLCQEQAQILTRLCKPEGSQVWSLLPQQVEMKNPLWETAIQKLCRRSALELGFKDIRLRPILSKALIYGTGGRLDKIKDVDGDTHIVARLIVQLPTLHKGADLLVFENKTSERCARNVLGKGDGTAAFKSHFAAYAAETYHAVTPVTGGFQLTLVYSLCLPPELLVTDGKRRSDLLRVQLSQAMNKLENQGVAADITTETRGRPSSGNKVLDKDGNSAVIALMLTKSTPKEHIQSKGTKALAGADYDQFNLLWRANSLLPPTRKLKFYIACLEYRYTLIKGTGSHDEKYVTEKVSWYSLNGKSLCSASIEWTKTFYFLNPGNETLGQLWKNNQEFHSYYERFAIVGWAESADIAMTHKLMKEVGAIASVLAANPIDNVMLRKLISYQADLNKNRSQPGPCVTLNFCQKLCTAISAMGDVDLARVLLGRYFSRVYHQQAKLTPLFAVLIRKFGWDTVGTLVVEVINALSSFNRVGVALILADEFYSDSAVQTQLTIAAVTMARHDSYFNFKEHLGLLWKSSMVCTNPQVFHDVVKLFSKMSVAKVGPVVDALSKCVDGSSSMPHRNTLACMATRRREWLTAEIGEIERPFTLTILDANFPNAADITAFLQGPRRAFTISGFTGIAGARTRVELLNGCIKAPIEITANGRGQWANVRILKTGGKFAEKTQKMIAYKAELDRLNCILQSDITADRSTKVTGKKRSRGEGETGGVD